MSSISNPIQCRGSALLALLLLGSGCDSSLGGGTSGEVGNGTFDYVCTNSGDAACSKTKAIDEFRVSEDLGTKGAIPGAVAVDSVFSLAFDPNGSVDKAYRITPASDDDERTTNEFRIGVPGEASFIAMEGTNEASDYTVLVAREAIALQLWAEQDVIDDVRLRVEDDSTQSLDVTVVPVDEDETLLAGAFPYRWVSLDESIVSLSRFGAKSGSDEVKNEGDVTLHAEGRGVTKVRVTSGDLGVEFFVEVK